MYELLEIHRVLIVGPKRVAENVWDAEIEKWAHIKHLSVSKIMGDQKKRLSAIKQSADIYTISVNNLVWLINQYGGHSIPFDMVVIDESSGFKNPKSKRFKAFKRVTPSLERVVILTGTPAPNGLIDIWSQIFLLDQGARLGRFITRFREKYFRPGARRGDVVFKYNLQEGADEQIYGAIGDICISMKAEDHLKLKGRHNNYIDVRFDDKLQKAYNDFEKECVLELFDSNTEITAVNAAALNNKLLQFANGAVYDDDKNYHVVHDLKLDALGEIIEGAQGKPVLVAWTYRSDMHRIKERFKGARELKASQDIKDWNAGEIPLMIMHPASGGHGLNLQTGGNIIVWFGQTWSLELYQQFNARLDRQGQADKVMIHHLVAHKTVEQDVVESLAMKDKTQDGLMRAVKARVKKYLRNIS